MEVFLSVRPLQNGAFTKFDTSEIKDEMYLAYIIYRISKHPDLRLDSNSYSHFFFESRREETILRIKKWINSNEGKLKIFEGNYINMITKYCQIYELYKDADYSVRNRPMLHTGIPFVDAYIAKETLMQVIYDTLHDGNCKGCNYYYNLSSEDKKQVENKLEQMLVYQEKLSQLLNEMNQCKYIK